MLLKTVGRADTTPSAAQLSHMMASNVLQLLLRLPYTHAGKAQTPRSLKLDEFSLSFS